MDQARADKARRACRTKKVPCRNHGKPLRKTGPDGRPLLRNKKGVCVLDSKKMKTLQADCVKASLKVKGPQAQDAGSHAPQANLATVAEHDCSRVCCACDDEDKPTSISTRH